LDSAESEPVRPYEQGVVLQLWNRTGDVPTIKRWSRPTFAPTDTPARLAFTDHFNYVPGEAIVSPGMPRTRKCCNFAEW